MMRIDSHHHVWSLERGDYGWLTPSSGVLYRDYKVEMLQPLIEQGDIDATILVQAAPTEAETRFMLREARRTPWITGVVGWTDLEAPSAPRHIAELALEPLLVGLRPMLQDLPDPRWILGEQVGRGLAVMADEGLVLDALVLPSQIEAITTVAADHPRLSIVLDHAGKPRIGEDIGAWADDMHALAANANVSVKLSGLLTEAPPGAAAGDLVPYFDELLAAFGADRVVWGSDWPVVTQVASYSEWLAMTDALLRPLSSRACRAIMGGNAARIYRLTGVHE